LLMFLGVTPAHKRLSLSGLSSKYLYRRILFIFTIQGTHRCSAIWRKCTISRPPHRQAPKRYLQAQALHRLKNG
jgi:hypothetical protein